LKRVRMRVSSSVTRVRRSASAVSRSAIWAVSSVWRVETSSYST